MTAQRIAALLLAASLAAAAGAVAQEPQKSSPATATDAVLAQEKAMVAAIQASDWTALGQAVGADFVYVDPNGAFVWELSRTAELMRGCTSKNVVTDNMQATPTAERIMVVTYTLTVEQVCNGKKGPSPAYMLSVWSWQGTRWLMVAHSETPVPVR